MDSFSGRFPLDFISFYLDMSSEEINEENPGLTVGSQPEESAPQTQGETRPRQENESQTETEPKEQEKPGGEEAGQSRVEPTPSPSTDGSISAYIERTLQTLGCQGTGLGLIFLPPVTTTATGDKQQPETEKASQSDPIVHTITEPPKKTVEVETDGQAALASETGFSVTRPDYFQTDASDVEELLDSSGAETGKDPPKLIHLCKASTTCSEVTQHAEAEQSKIPAMPDPEALRPSRPLSASARTIIRQHLLILPPAFCQWDTQQLLLMPTKLTRSLGLCPTRRLPLQFVR